MLTLATTAVVGLALGPGSVAPSWAAAEGPATPVTVEGTVERVVADGASAVDPGALGGVSQSSTHLEVDGTLYGLPAPLADDVAPGSEVRLTVAVPAGEAVESVLAELATDPDAALELVPTAHAPLAGASAGASAGVSAGVVGTRTLTVLPVHWGNRDGATTASLGALATETARYWAEQSANRITIQPATRPWARIPAPAGCDSRSIMTAALAANPGVVPGGDHHVAVYFPRLTACSWVGQAQVGGTAIWINGTELLDVAAHEMGHNLGLGHADRLVCTAGGVRVTLSASCTRDEYFDRADVMGMALLGRPTGSLNAALAHSLGLARVVSVPAVPATVDLAPLQATGGVRALTVPVPQGTLFVDFRPAVGRDTRWSQWAGVQVHLRTLDRNGAPTTALLDLQPGAGSFTAPQLSAAGWDIPGTGRTLRLTSVGASHARVELVPTAGAGPTPAPAPVPSPAARYVERVYADLFGRSVDPAGLASWTTALAAGTPRGAVANAITSSWEYRARLIDGSYQRYLQRSADPTGMADWQRAMAAGWTVAQIQSGFVASAEHHARSGGTDAAWVRALYQDVLERPAGADEVRSWTSVLARGASRQDVSLGFLLSTEHLNAVVDGHYRHLLGRGLDPAGRASWVGVLRAGGRDESVIGAIVSSEEYVRRG